MRALKAAGVLTFVALSAARPGFAQSTATPRVFVDGALMADLDPTEFFYGSDSGAAGRGAIGARLSDRHGVRFEVDVPRWRVVDTNAFTQVWCANESDCLTKNAWAPAHTTSRTAVRTVSYALLYSLHLPAVRRLELALVAGGSIEQRGYQSSGTFDELAANGDVVRHHAYADDRIKYWPAGVVGVDADVRLTSHLAVTPQFRFHTFPYPAVSIIRPGIALRWHF